MTNLLLNLGSVGGTAGLNATITTGRFAGDHILIANLRNPLALIYCLTTGLAQATGVTTRHQSHDSLQFAPRPRR